MKPEVFKKAGELLSKITELDKVVKQLENAYVDKVDIHSNDCPYPVRLHTLDALMKTDFDKERQQLAVQFVRNLAGLYRKEIAGMRAEFEKL